MPPSTTPARSSAIKTKTKLKVSLALSPLCNQHTRNPKRANTRTKRRRRPPRARETPHPTRALDQKVYPRPFRRQPIALARSRTRRTASRVPRIRSPVVDPFDRSIRTVPKTARSPRSATRVAIARRVITNEEKSLLYASTVVGSSRDVARACGDVTERRARGLAGRAML